MQTLIQNIGFLYGILPPDIQRLKGKEMAKVTMLQNAWLAIDKGKIHSFGTQENLPNISAKTQIIDAKGQTILPGLIDSHTHLVFPKTREEEFKMKIEGKYYEEIAAAGGGILNSAKAMQNTPKQKLFSDAKERLLNCINFGTVAIEIKSGYGLTTETELGMLEVAGELKNLELIPIKRSLLGAHALPAEFKNNRSAYLEKVKNEMIPQAAQNNLADYVDVFCEKGFFTPMETEEILIEGAKHGLKGKIHANQLAISGGVQAGVNQNAISVDHLENIGEEEIEALKNSDTLPVALPGCSFYLNMVYTPGRKIIDAGLPLVLASDFNPGSCPSGNLLFVWSLACIKMKLLPEEAFNALTINAAAALELQNELGSISVGKRASLLFFPQGTNLARIPYHFSMSKPNAVMLEGSFDWKDKFQTI